MCKCHAFYRTSRSVVLEPGERVPLGDWAVRVIQIFSKGDDVWQLHLDNHDDFENICKCFFTPDYWAGRTWEQEYQEL